MLHKAHADEFGCFWLALGAYALFLILAVGARAGGAPSPQAAFNKLHFRTAALYVIGWGMLLAWRSWPGDFSGLSDFLVGLFLYFGIHYAIVGPFFVLAQASVSTSILSIIHAHGGKATEAQCQAAYGGGSGFASIKQVRMARIERLLGWVELRDGKYALTGKGMVIARLTKFLLALWGLRQIGQSRAGVQTSS